jgi:hypothetical protein
MPIGVREIGLICACVTLRRAPTTLEGSLAELAPAVLGALGDKDAGAHAAMWDMLLSFVRAYPGAWAAIDARKAFLPRLLALLRCRPLAGMSAVYAHVPAQHPPAGRYLCRSFAVISLLSGGPCRTRWRVV